MQYSNAVELLAVPGIPRVAKDDDLVALIGEGVARGGIVPRGGDVFVLAQKIVARLHSLVPVYARVSKEDLTA